MDSLVPIFLIIVLGWMLRRTEFLSLVAVEAMTRLTYWVGIPCLLFSKTASLRPALGQVADLFIVTAGSTTAGIILSYLLALFLRVPKMAIGTFVQAAFRGNLAFVGLPVIYYAFSASKSGAATAEASALLVFGPMVLMYNVVAVVVLLLSRHGLTVQAVRPLVGEIVTNPLLFACLTGSLYSGLNLPLPMLLKRSLDALGEMALPLALICIGGSLNENRSHRGTWLWSSAAAAVKVVLLPVIGYTMARILEVGSDNTKIALILLTCPTAAASYVLVQELGGDENLASGAIVLSTLLAALSLALVLGLL
jgi:predicted permease